MIETQTFESYPVFGDNGTKAAPDAAKYAAGFTPSDVLPAEWMNWAWNHNTKGITALNTGLKAVEEELNAILTAGGQVPDGTSGQVLLAIQYVIQTKTGNLANLNTTAKSTIVAACNELKSSITSLQNGMANYYTKTEMDAEFTAKTTISPDTGNALSRKNNGLYADCVPIGTVIQTLRTTAPSGYLMMNDSETIYDQADYPLLFEVLPDSLKNGLHFTLPDMTQRFVQGGSDLGTSIEPGIPDITGVLRVRNMSYQSDKTIWEFDSTNGALGIQMSGIWGDSISQNSGDKQLSNMTFKASHGETKIDGTLKTDDDLKVYGKSETVQPPAVIMNFMIKAR